MADINDMGCPRCDADIEVEYEREFLHGVSGACEHAVQWNNNTLEDVNEYNRKLWQWIENYWADRAEAEQEARWETRGER